MKDGLNLRPKFCDIFARRLKRPTLIDTESLGNGFINEDVQIHLNAVPSTWLGYRIRLYYSYYTIVLKAIVHFLGPLILMPWASKPMWIPYLLAFLPVYHLIVENLNEVKSSSLTEWFFKSLEESAKCRQENLCGQTVESKPLAYRHILKTVVKVVEEKFKFLCFSSLPAIRCVDPPCVQRFVRFTSDATNELLTANISASLLIHVFVPT